MQVSRDDQSRGNGSYGSLSPKPSPKFTSPKANADPEKVWMQNRERQMRLWILVILFGCAMLGEGYDMGVLNGAIVQIKADFGLSPREVGFVVAITPLAILAGAGVHSIVGDQYGRRTALLSTVILLMIGPLTMACGVDLFTIMLGRSICGIGMGGGLLVVTMMVTEISPPAQRGRLVACGDVALNLGMVVAFFISWLLVGTQNDWRWMLAIGSMLPIPLAIVLAGVYFTGAEDDAIIPETPRWLAMQGRFGSVEKVLQRYYADDEAEEQLQELSARHTPKTMPKTHSIASELNALNNPPKFETLESDEFITWPEILYPMQDRRLVRMMTVGILVAVGEMICGATSVAYYSNSIMKEDLGTSAAFLATVVMGVVRVLGVIAATICVDHVGRRTLLLLSASVMTVACVWISVTAHLRMTATLLPIGLCLMMLGFVIGCGSVSLVYISEVFPTAVRSKAMAICMFWCRVAGASSAMAYPLLVDCCGISFTFLLQALVNFALLALIFLLVPETKGLTLEEVYHLFE